MDKTFNPRVLDKIAYQNGIRSDTKLARHLGVNRSTLARWRSGESTPNYGTLSLMVLRDGITIEEMHSESQVLAA